MVVIPAGEYMMGSPDGEEGRKSDEGPRHQVRTGEGFAVGKYEVTVDEFALFVWETGHDMSGGCRGYDAGEGKWKTFDDRSWGRPGFSQTGVHPVVCVSWEDAKAYVEWLSGETGEGYRLMSEAEWEYVARAGTRTSWFWGDSEGEQCKNGNGAGTETTFDWRNKACGDGYGETAPVGSFVPNGYGLYDVHGNVWEWVEDCWHGDYEGAPTEGSAWVSGGDCGKRVLRGGSWGSRPRYLRSANRLRLTAGNRYFSNGFRVARTLTP